MWAADNTVLVGNNTGAGSPTTSTYSGMVDVTGTVGLFTNVVLTPTTGSVYHSTTHPIAPASPQEDVIEPDEEEAGAGDACRRPYDHFGRRLGRES